MLQNTENSWRVAIKLTTPIFMGYLAGGAAYGLLATHAGLPVWFTLAMCFTVFSGTAQYAAIPFFATGTGLTPVFLSTFLISLRFAFYTLNMRDALPKEKYQKMVSVGYMTDENFALLSTLPPEVQKGLVFKTSLLGMSYWTFATIIGIVLGDSLAGYIPNLGFALPCLFAILAYEQYKKQKQWKPMCIALISFLLAYQISDSRILLSAILIAILLVAFLPKKFISTERGEK